MGLTLPCLQALSTSLELLLWLFQPGLQLYSQRRPVVLLAILACLLPALASVHPDSPASDSQQA